MQVEPPTVLDDPNLAGWKQADWLAWLDLVGLGVTARTRFANTPMQDFRAIATNKKTSELFLDKHGRAMESELVSAIKNKGKFVDLYDERKLN